MFPPVGYCCGEHEWKQRQAESWYETVQGWTGKCDGKSWRDKWENVWFWGQQEEQFDILWYSKWAQGSSACFATENNSHHQNYSWNQKRYSSGKGIDMNE